MLFPFLLESIPDLLKNANPLDGIPKKDYAQAIKTKEAVIMDINEEKILLLEYDEEYPQYNFKKHKGYGTKEHTDLILKYGPCKIHRMSFLKKLLGDKK